MRRLDQGILDNGARFWNAELRPQAVRRFDRQPRAEGFGVIPSAAHWRKRKLEEPHVTSIRSEDDVVHPPLWGHATISARREKAEASVRASLRIGSVSPPPEQSITIMPTSRSECEWSDQTFSVLRDRHLVTQPQRDAKRETMQFTDEFEPAHAPFFCIGLLHDGSCRGCCRTASI